MGGGESIREVAPQRIRPCTLMEEAGECELHELSALLAH